MLGKNNGRKSIKQDIRQLISQYERDGFSIDELVDELFILIMPERDEFAHCVPYQRCPICEGSGKIPAEGFTSSIYMTCDTCNGMKIIPMASIQGYRNG